MIAVVAAVSETLGTGKFVHEANRVHGTLGGDAHERDMQETVAPHHTDVE